MSQPTDLVGIGVVATELGVSPSRVRQLADDGSLTAYRTDGGHRRFSLAEVREVVAGRAGARGSRAGLKGVAGMADGSVGGKITTLRESLGLTAAELAERCDCEPALIEGLEAGDLAPSLAPLIKITRALGVRLGTLLDDESTIGPVVTRSGAAELVTRMKGTDSTGTAGKLDFFSLAGGKASKHMEPFLIDIDPASAYGHLSTHEGEEFIHVLAGEVEVAYGKESHVLKPGDSIYYDSIVPHEVRAANGQAARILAVVYAPF